MFEVAQLVDDPYESDVGCRFTSVPLGTDIATGLR
jgi:hypothetical protein